MSYTPFFTHQADQDLSSLQKLPLLADKRYLKWDENPDDIASRISELKTDIELV